MGRRVDGRADVYALALVLYEALTGTVPFSADTTIGTLMARVGAEIPAHDALFPLEEVLRGASAPEPEDRLGEASELARWLSEAARELPAPGSLPEGRQKAWRPYDDITEMGATSAPSSVESPDVIETSPDAGADAMALASAIGVADRSANGEVATANRATAATTTTTSAPPIPPLPPRVARRRTRRTSPRSERPRNRAGTALPQRRSSPSRRTARGGPGCSCLRSSCSGALPQGA